MPVAERRSFSSGVESIIQRSFTSGELSPELAARADQVKYITGLGICRNAIVRRHGGVVNRPGSKFVAETKFSSKASRLMAFVFTAADESYMIEVGDLYLRFFWHGAPVVVVSAPAFAGGTTYDQGDLVTESGTIYYSKQDANTGNTPPDATWWHPLSLSPGGASHIFEVPTPYAAADVGSIKHVQSLDVLVLAHPTYQPHELQRFGHTTWKLVPLVTAPSIGPPVTGLVGNAGAPGSRTFKYIITTAKLDTFEESLGSDVITISAAAAPTVDNPHTLEWDDVAGKQEYYVHADPYDNGIYGFIGATETNSFNDVGFAPDFTVTPPIPKVLFDAVDDYPSAVAHYQQRLVFGNSNNHPETVWASRTGAFHNFSISTPLQDDDSIQFDIASKHINPVAHILALKRLIVLSDAGEWIIRGDPDGGVLRPVSINADQEGYVGADASVDPLVIGNSMIYVQALGTIVRDLRFDFEVQGIAGRDITVFSTHLFEKFTLTDMVHALLPQQTVWACRSDGTLLGLTYVREHDVIAWHRHDTGASGKYERVESLPAVKEDEVYVIVNRTIDGATKRYVELFQPRFITTLATDAFFVDAGLSYSGGPAQTIAGLEHLEGEVLSVLGDGQVIHDANILDDPTRENFRVVNGEVKLPISPVEIHAGLPITAEIETLAIDVEGTSVRDKKKRVMALTVLVDQSTPDFWAGPDADHLIKIRRAAWEAFDDTVTSPLEVSLTSSYNKDGKVRLRHTAPLPWSVLAVMPNLDIGG